MTNKQALLVGCASAVLAAGLIIAAVTAWVFFIAQDPAGVAVSVEGPTTVTAGDNFTLSVVVRNQRESDEFGLTDIDVAEVYLDNFILLGTTPPATSNMHIPIDNSRSFTFDVDIPAGEAMRFDFELRSIEPGLFRGDVDVCEGQRFLSAYLQTEVRPFE